MLYCHYIKGCAENNMSHTNNIQIVIAFDVCMEVPLQVIVVGEIS